MLFLIVYIYILINMPIPFFVCIIQNASVYRRQIMREGQFVTLEEGRRREGVGEGGRKEGKEGGV